MAAMSSKSQVLCRYRELLRLISRLPSDQRTPSLLEAQQTIRSRRGESNPQAALQHYKELVSKIGFLRIITPKSSGHDLRSGRYVMRDGELVEGGGSGKGQRVGESTMSMEQAQKLNNKHFERFFGKKKSSDMFF